MALLLSAFALAQEPIVPDAPPEPAPPPAPTEELVEPKVYEVTVYGQAAIRDARAQVVRAFESEGWRSKGRSDGVVLKGPHVWMGKAHLSDEGMLTFTRPFVVFKALNAGASGGEPDSTSSDPPGAVQGTPTPETKTLALEFGFPGRRKVQAAQERALNHVQDEVQHFNDVIRATALQEQIEALPGRLDALWNDGAPLEGTGVALATPEQRKADALGWWASRADGPEGIAVSEVIETWIRETVQASPTPVTPDEAAKAEAGRADGRKLRLETE
jgi:hypothetical protein